MKKIIGRMFYAYLAYIYILIILNSLHLKLLLCPDLASDTFMCFVHVWLECPLKQQLPYKNNSDQKLWFFFLLFPFAWHAIGKVSNLYRWSNNWFRRSNFYFVENWNFIFLICWNFHGLNFLSSCCTVLVLTFGQREKWLWIHLMGLARFTILVDLWWFDGHFIRQQSVTTFILEEFLLR